MLNALRRMRDSIDEAVLKYIAVSLMLVDHIAFCLDRYAYIDPSLYGVMRFMGRAAFPLFCYFLSEGMLHTRNAGRYMLRLAVSACLSELPFDLMVSGRLWYPECQNVLFTLAVSAGMLYLLPRCPSGVPVRIFEVFVIVAAAALTAILRSDYTWAGPLLVYAFRYTGFRLYNGSRGKQNGLFFYIFYPVHMLLLFLISHGV